MIFFYIIEVSTFFYHGQLMSQNTITGKINETTIEQFLIENYDGDVYSQVELGTKFGTKKKHFLDILLDGEVLWKKIGKHLFHYIKVEH